MSGTDIILKDAKHWVSSNRRLMSCIGICRHGPCMCKAVRHRDKRAFIDERLTIRGYIAVEVCRPIGKDNHMAAIDPLVVTAKTIAFIMDMRDISRERDWKWKSGEEQEWWGEYYDQRHKVVIIKPSEGYRYVKRVAK
jgi:hypothetical protein